eukprot:TRINITY_DN3454_c0_g1_i10.p1 TRINITY_DN3454_c0_g1~~TRINITY_DN3454_c0_g1_i10.p1  ORF type:complete len:371 (-),score=64.70 TRINITY_DN3454_c0_g1_i10:97-1209(-)
MCIRDRLMYNVNDLMDYARWNLNQSDLHFNEFELQPRIEEVFSIFRMQAKIKSVEYILDLGVDIPSLMYGESRRLGQILVNLLANAFKFTTKGRISLSVSSSQRLGYVRFVVSDTGVGMTEDALAQLTEALSQGVDSDSFSTLGIGLGLRVSTQLLRLLGGEELGVISRKDKGASFFFELPIYASGRSNLASGRSNLASGPSITSKLSFFSDEIVDDFTEPLQPIRFFEHRLNSLKDIAGKGCPCPKVLIVDDNDYNRLVVSRQLQTSLIPFDEAANGQLAVELLYKDKACPWENCPKYRLILMDLDMPIMNGFDATRAIRQLYPRIPIVICSALDDHQARLDALNVGASEYLQKPIKPEELSNVLKRYL